MDDHRGGGLRDGRAEKSLRGGGGHQCGDHGATTGFAHDGHAVRVAAEGAGVVVDPAQCRQQVGVARVGVHTVGRVGALAQGQLAEDTHAVVHGHVDAVDGLGEVFAGQQRLVRGAVDVRPAVEVDHHRAACFRVDGWCR